MRLHGFVLFSRLFCGESAVFPPDTAPIVFKKY